MTELIIRIDNPLTLEQLLPVLQQLNIGYKTRAIEAKAKNKSKKAAIIAKMEAGAFDLPHLATWMDEFQQSRQDSLLVGRN